MIELILDGGDKTNEDTIGFSRKRKTAWVMDGRLKAESEAMT